MKLILSCLRQTQIIIVADRMVPELKDAEQKVFTRDLFGAQLNLEENMQQKTTLITGAAGFIGFHVSKLLLQEGWRDC